MNANKISMKLGSYVNLEVRFNGPFEILERIGPYRITLPTSIHSHNMFPISLLKKYVLDVNHVIDWNIIRVESEVNS